MKVDFYQLSRDPADKVVPLLARNTLKAGERLLVVSADDEATNAKDALYMEMGKAAGRTVARADGVTRYNWAIVLMD